MCPAIDTAAFSEAMRQRGVDRTASTVRITNLRGSKQETDLTEPANCGGFGRVRHFTQRTSPGWPSNPLPIEPAVRALGLEGPVDGLEAQVFQNAVCNWRCWYCFVDFELLSGREDRSSMLSPSDLVTLYLAEASRPSIIDLSGGQPDLVPEWVPWMMTALEAAGLADKVFLWSDDNLSNDYFWRYLTKEERARVSGYPSYGKVCCFKGFDPHSFAFNTSAEPDLLARQLELMGRLVHETAIDLYGYVTLTTNRPEQIPASVSSFVDRLQEIDPNLPLRTVPLQISAFTPVTSRMHSGHERALHLQEEAVAAWSDELTSRFSLSARELAMPDVPFTTR